MKDKIFGGILGLAVADAVGVPVEFQSRESLRRNPVADMKGYGTYNQPPGTWSDDTSLTLCLLDSLATGFRYGRGRCSEIMREDYISDRTMENFLSWLDEGKYTAHGKVFDVGIATRKALQRFKNGIPLECGGTSEMDNGNGSLMRILPLAFYFHKVPPQSHREFWDIIHEASALTHAHKRSQIACGLYLSVAESLFDKTNLKEVIHSGLEKAKKYYENEAEYVDDLKHYKRLFDPEFSKLPEEEIKSSGYVVDTLEAALWCLMNTDNYRDCILRAVNLGEDTDTVAAVAGGLAGMFYGVDAIPKEWLSQLARRDFIEKLCDLFHYSAEEQKMIEGLDIYIDPIERI